MRVAVCFSGQARVGNFDHLRASLVDTFDADVFCHFWNTECCHLQPNLLVEKSKPARYEIEEQITFPVDESVISAAVDNGVVNVRHNYQNTYSMFYSMYRANELKKEAESEYGFTYDMVIRTRTDLEFSNLCLRNEFESNPDSLWTCSQELVNPHGPNIDDRFAFANNRTMDVYSSIFHAMPNLVKQTPFFHPEVFLYRHLANNDIDVKVSKSRFEIVR